jgi:tetratricopeptide (TPR) repeat protein
MKSKQTLLPSILCAALALPLVARARSQDQPHLSGRSTDSVEEHLARGHQDLNNHRYEQAEAEFRAALAIDPHLTVRARFPLAVALFALQDRDEARRQFETIRSETGDDPNLSYYLGRLDLTDGKFDSAIRNLTLATSRPPFPDTAFYLGDAYLKKREFDSAEEWLEKAAQLAPDDFRVPERLGLLYQAMGRNEDAQRAFALSSKLRQQDTSASEIGLECDHSLQTEPTEQARQVCQKLYNPADLGDLLTLGMLYGEHKDYTDALEPLRLAVKLDPDSYEASYNLSLTYFRLHRYAESRAPLERAAALRPDAFEVNALLGSALYALGDDAAAYSILDRANRLDPQNPDVSRFLFNTALGLANRSLQRHDSASARKYLLRAAEVRPDDPQPHRELAEIYAASGDSEQAQREREQAARLASH